MKVLKLIWARAENGWHIRSAESVELAPRDGAESDFYAVKDGIVISQPNFFGPTSYVMGQSIVPVVAIVDGEDAIRCLGTAFFISCTGILITAAHVITDPIERQYGDVSTLDDLTWHTRQMNLGVMLPVNPALYGPGFYVFLGVEWAMFLAEKREHPLPIRGIDLKLTSDIAICKVPQLSPTTPHQALSIKQRGVRGVGIDVGKSATALGYAGMNETIPLKGEPGPEADFKFNLHVSKGQIIERFPDNMRTRSVAAPGPCFSTSANYPGGMSGSPIFDDEMIYVHGVVSRGGLQDLSYGCMLEPSMHLPVKHLGGKTIAELMAVGGEGIPRISIADA